MSKHRLSAFLLAVIFLAGVCPVQSAEPSAEAKQHAALYKAEVRKVLEERHWTIKRDESGKLVAVHTAGADMSGQWTLLNFVEGNPYAQGAAHLTILFKGDSMVHTTTKVESQLYMRAAGIGNPLVGPYPFIDDGTKKVIQSIMSQAEKQLAAKRPEYLAR